MGINFYFLVAIKLNERKKLRSFIHQIIAAETGRDMGSLNVIFCSDDYLLTINRDYLQHDYYTDIITFDLANNTSLPVNGEIYISIERVKENASIFGVTVSQELHRVIFHGVLHLCGYKDKRPGDQRQMKEKENHYLATYTTFHVEHI